MKPVVAAAFSAVLISGGAEAATLSFAYEGESGALSITGSFSFDSGDLSGGAVLGEDLSAFTMSLNSLGVPLQTDTLADVLPGVGISFSGSGENLAVLASDGPVTSSFTFTDPATVTFGGFLAVTGAWRNVSSSTVIPLPASAALLISALAAGAAASRRARR